MTEEQFSFVKAEHQVLDFWKKNKIFQKSLEKNKKGPIYIFYDGPPFATGLPHHGHLVASTIKDIVPRYFTMQGFYIDRRFGWDCHGLPIEQEIDKEFGVSASDYVAEHGIKKYNNACRQIVLRFTKEWEKTVTRLGRWVDFERDYKTMDLSFMESVWWVFKQAWNKELIYQGNKVVPYSTALQTALSNFEASSNYQTVQDPAITVLFKLKDEEAYLAAWTTTPWTLPSNLGLCVHEEIDYLKLKEKKSEKIIYLAKERLEAYSKKREFEQIAVVKGKDLVGKKYEPLFDYFEDLEKKGAFVILSDSFVSTEEGTGIVHMAPAFGEDDNRIFRQASLSSILVSPIDAACKFTNEVSDFEGLYVKDADKLIIRKLKETGLLWDQSTLEHSYPFCPRTDTPLIYKAQPQWYLNVEKIKESIMAANEKINWVPDHIKKGRFGKWLENARDWAISRNRFWGTPLPIWQNQANGKTICFGSIEELEAATGQKISDLHRETIDELSFSKDGEQGIYKRVPEVLDCWFESGSMPYAQLHYPFENKALFEQGFPAEFIAEGLDQTRGWFYTLMVLSTMLFDKPAFKNVVVNGLVLSSDGRKMSKRLKNYTPPNDVMENFGADALRLYLINSGVVKGEELRFSDEGLKEMVRKGLLPWWNAFKFFQTYSVIDGWSPQKDLKLGENILDRWILSKLQTLTQKVTKGMNAYKLYEVVPALFDFIEDLTNWYIRLNRRRFWEQGLEDDKKEAYSTLYTTLRELGLIMAPFAPFLSEHIFQELKKIGNLREESVHLADFPKADSSLINPKLEDAVGRMQQIIIMGRQKREHVKIKTKTPLNNLTILHKEVALLAEIKKLASYIQAELNVKKLDYSQEESKYIKLYARPNAAILGKRLGKKFGSIRKQILELSQNDCAKLESGNSLNIAGENLTSEEVLVYREAKEESGALSNRWISICLDCQLNQDLIEEGLAREIVNRIQRLRKQMDFNVADRIEIAYCSDEVLQKVIEKYKDYISKEVLAQKIEATTEIKNHEVFQIDESSLKISLKKIT